MKQMVSKLLFGTIVALAVSVVTTQTAQAHWSWHSGWQQGWSCNNDKGSSDNKGSKGSSDNGSKGSSDKGSKGSNSSCNWGHKGSKGSSDKGSKGSNGFCNWGHKGPKGSSDKGSKGSNGSCNWGHKGSKGSSDKGSKGSKGSSCNVGATGKVCGLVFIDSDDNGRFSRWDDERLANVTVIITDSNGKQHIVKTNKRGFYCAKGIPAGDATVKIDENTLPNGVEQVIGDNPTPIYVRPHRRNWAGKDGYSQPAATGSVCGKVFEDTNGNGVQDAGEPDYAGAKVNITDENGNTVTATTDANGKYCQDGIEAGSVEVVVDPNSLPAGATITTENPTTITVEAGQNNPAGADGFEPAPTTGKVCGKVFEDTNGNGVQDAGEPDYAGAKVNITDETGNTVTATTDANGQYCQDGIEAGSVEVVVDPDSLPSGATITTENPTTITVEAGQNNPAGADGFKPGPTGTVCGVVFADINKNGRIDYGEPGLANITVTITDSNNRVTTVETDADGKYCASGIAKGEAVVDVDENDPDMPANSEPTRANDPSTVTVIANKQNNAGIDGYYYPDSGLGCVCTLVYIDKNADGRYRNADDKGIPNVTVTLVDSQGTTHTLQTNASGYILAVLPLGETTMSIDENSPSIPADMTLLAGKGMNPVTFENKAQKDSPTYYGFVSVITP